LEEKLAKFQLKTAILKTGWPKFNHYIISSSAFSFLKRLKLKERRPSNPATFK
jgi:hypothetical protein